jgi:predicted RNA-binding Zn ribbon-like protein
LAVCLLPSKHIFDGNRFGFYQSSGKLTVTGAEGSNMTESGDHSFCFLGNLPCLDFVNTEIIARGARVDLLTGFADLVRWLQAANLLSAEEARTTASRWGNATEGKSAFRESVSLRGALRVMAERLSAKRPVDRTSIELVNRVLESRPTYRQVELKGGKFVSRSYALSESPLHLLAPIAESAAWLLENGDMSLLRRCENPDCILFFYDTTKNKRRRWCSMDACGSRAKAAAYYRRSHLPSRRRSH